MIPFFKKLRHQGIPLYIYSAVLSLILSCLFLLLFLSFYLISQELSAHQKNNFDFEQAAQIIKNQIHVQTSPFFALAESQQARIEDISSLLESANMRSKFVQSLMPIFKYNLQTYYISYILEDGTSLFLLNYDHIRKIALESKLSKFFAQNLKELPVPVHTDAILFIIPANDSTEQKRLEFYGQHGECLGKQNCPQFLDALELPYYTSTIHAKSMRISAPYLTDTSQRFAVTISYPIKNEEQKGVFAITVHLEATFLQNSPIIPDASLYILDDTLTKSLSAHPSPKDFDILTRCEGIAIVNDSVTVHNHDFLTPRQETQGVSKMFEDLLAYHKHSHTPIIKTVNKLTFNSYSFDYYVTDISVFGRKTNILILHRPETTISNYEIFSKFAMIACGLALFLIAIHFYIVYKKTITLVALTGEARRLANYDFSTPPPIHCHSSELISLNRALVAIRLILVDAFAYSPYKSAIKFDSAHPQSVKTPIALPKEELDDLEKALEKDFINGKYTEDQYVQAKLHHKRQTIRKKALTQGTNTTHNNYGDYDEQQNFHSHENDEQILNVDNKKDFSKQELSGNLLNTSKTHSSKSEHTENFNKIEKNAPSLLPYSSVYAAERRLGERRASTGANMQLERRKNERRSQPSPDEHTKKTFDLTISDAQFKAGLAHVTPPEQATNTFEKTGKNTEKTK